MNLAYAAMLGNPELVNKEADTIQKVSTEDISRVAKSVLAPENCSTLFYKSVE